MELDAIVNEVKESEEWEEVKMDILDYGIEMGKEIGRAEGIEQGIEQGEILTLVNQVSKKLQKGLVVAEIANHLEEPTEKIQKIVDCINQGMDVGEIYLLCGEEKS